MANEATPEKLARVHIYEIDLIRAITVFSVVAIHSLSATTFLVPKPASSVQLLNLIIHALHYNREMFMFVTGLVLTFVYFRKQFSVKKFWIKRMLLVLVPYIVWTGIYVKINNPDAGLSQYLNLSLTNVLTGNASYQLYYILLAVQFYLVFPLFLWFLKKVAHHPWLTLSISLVLQLIAMYIDFTYFQTNAIQTPFVTQFLLPYQDRIFISYQFFFFFGAFAAIYMNAAATFLKKYGVLSLLFLILVLALFSVDFSYHINTLHQSMWYAMSVLQPSVVIYSIVAIIFFSWLALLWAKQKKLYWLVKSISDVSFGVYFVHVFLLTLVVSYVVPLFQTVVPVPITILITVLCTFIASVVFCFILLKVPLLSWTIGRARPLWKTKKVSPDYAKPI